MRESRVQNASQPYIYKHGSKWVGDFRKSTFAHRRNNVVSYYVDAAGNRSRSWNSRQTRRNEYVRHIGVDLHDFIGAGRYQRRSSKILRCEYEFVEVSTTCVLVKRTNTIWKLPNPTGRYSQVTDQMVATAIQGSPSVVEEQIFALLVSENTLPSTFSQAQDNPRNLQQQSLYLGVEQELNNSHIQPTHATKTTPAQFSASMVLKGQKEEHGYVIIKELRGAAAKLWSKEGVSQQEVSRLLRPSRDETNAYTLPGKPKRKKIEWHESKETFSCGSLQFSKMNAEPPLVSGDSLYDVYRNEGINIVVSIPEKCLITFPRDGQFVSHEVDSGVFAIRSLSTMEGSIKEQRFNVLAELQNYRIEFDLNRYDFLTVVDIDNNILTNDEGSLGRIGSIETIDGKSTSESDSLLDRIG